ncbi:type I-E CRISPR-associated protein Cas6/Cse3/CasE [Prauserella marina]|uniref:CRISPR system Cascade subunit CasE n=1 Tax=Prauserella marina TaxID=530584 RepID=A0A222VND0_9PSEU|nr:type I-E CRISPR-associated protein Cas6/Cse3/CasE [Prauserella marina]ASR35273.1 type I-E CRISPR-associated protein Cas6/Cse3/CasE [Prauserella marina]PWV84951.1 CRISPR-associated Cse3 family protein [Prauserella marina]SDC08486.1 CRISPR system Cascade subunit CasE [Prauserella marina]
MSHLTRYEFNTARRGTRWLLSSPQRLHAAVLSSFPSELTQSAEDGRILWRLDSRPHQTLLYMVSPHRPDLTHLVEETGWPRIREWETRDYDPLLTRLAPGQRWTFRLTANPAQSRRRSETASRSQRFGHVTVAQQTQWLLDRVQKHGFAVVEGKSKEPDVAVQGRHTWKFTRSGQTVTIATVVFEGTLEVTDPAALRFALINGIGPAKGYGCGLLTLAAAR